MKSKRLLLLSMCLSSLFYAISYFCLSSYLPMIMHVLLLTRAIWYMRLDELHKPLKYYLIPFFLVNSLFVVALVFFWENITTIMLVIAMFILTFCLMFKNVLFIRISLIVNSIFWIVYDFSLKGYVNVLCSVVTIVLLLIAIFTYNIMPAIKKKRCLENNYDIKNIVKICKTDLV